MHSMSLLKQLSMQLEERSHGGSCLQIPVELGVRAVDGKWVVSGDIRLPRSGRKMAYAASKLASVGVAGLVGLCVTGGGWGFFGSSISVKIFDLIFYLSLHEFVTQRNKKLVVLSSFKKTNQDKVIKLCFTLKVLCFYYYVSYNLAPENRRSKSNFKLSKSVNKHQFQLIESKQVEKSWKSVTA